MPDNWVLIFSDGTGQRGVRNDDSVRNTNIFQMDTSNYRHFGAGGAAMRFGSA
jgi:hypothetical protein